MDNLELLLRLLINRLRFVYKHLVLHSMYILHYIRNYILLLFHYISTNQLMVSMNFHLNFAYMSFFILVCLLLHSLAWLNMMFLLSYLLYMMHYLANLFHYNSMYRYRYSYLLLLDLLFLLYIMLLVRLVLNFVMLMLLLHYIVLE